MFKVVKETIDRFIEWLVNKSKGATLEQKSISAIKTLGWLLTISAWLILTLIIVVINKEVRLKDTEHAAGVIKKLFDPQNNPLEQFAKMNQELSNHLSAYHDENLILVKDNLTLTSRNKYLEQENQLLSSEVISLKSVSEQCKKKK